MSGRPLGSSSSPGNVGKANYILAGQPVVEEAGARAIPRWRKLLFLEVILTWRLIVRHWLVILSLTWVIGAEGSIEMRSIRIEEGCVVSCVTLNASSRVALQYTKRHDGATARNSVCVTRFISSTVTSHEAQGKAMSGRPS
jgi:hypothetical protein